MESEGMVEGPNSGPTFRRQISRDGSARSRLSIQPLPGRDHADGMALFRQGIFLIECDDE